MVSETMGLDESVVTIQFNENVSHEVHRLLDGRLTSAHPVDELTYGETPITMLISSVRMKCRTYQSFIEAVDTPDIPIQDVTNALLLKQLS
jgi:hypothetical protein